MSKERISSLIFLLAGIYGLIFGIQLPLGSWREPGPGVLPLILSILLCVSGVLRFIFGKKKGEAEEKQKIVWSEMGKKVVTPLKILGVTTLFILLLERVGYLLASSLFVFILFFWISRYRLLVALGLALFIGVGTWYFFVKILSVQLPQGFLI